MRHSKRILYLMTAFLTALATILGVSQLQTDLLSFQISSGENIQSIRLWQREDGRYYVFLPSYAKMEDVRICLHTDEPVSMHNVNLEDGMQCTPFSEGVVYLLSYPAGRGYKQQEIMFIQSAKVAAMYIQTQNGSMRRIHADKKNQESGTVALYNPDGTLDFSGRIASLHGRGNNTWMDYEKKPYSMKLEDNANLLNLGSAQKWVLLANADDLSHMRNKIVLDFAKGVGLQYAPDAQWVDLYLNGEYAGLYLLSERNEVHPERVKQSEREGFLVSVEKRDRILAQEYPYISTDEAQYLRVHHPESPSDSQLQKLESIWQSVERAILAEDDIDPITGKTWMQQIDVDSWVKKYLIEEMFGNIDACFISQFFYCDGNCEESKIYAGPVWDYDHAMGSKPVWQLAAPNMLYGNRYDVNESFYTPWFYNLYRKNLFYERMTELYQYEFQPLLEEFLNVRLMEYSEQITKASLLDRVRWNAVGVSFRDQIEYLQNYMRERSRFLHRIWIEQEPYCLVKADDARGGFYGYYAVFPGEKLSALPVFESTETREFLGWYHCDTGEPFCVTEPVFRDTEICARWKIDPGLSRAGIVKRIPLVIFLLLFLALLYFERKRTAME